MYMVNNKTLRGYILPSLFFIFCLTALPISGQNILKYYVASSQNDGILYFIHPKQDFKGDHSILSYDLTTSTSKDSVTLNFSFQHKELLAIDSIAWSSPQLRIAMTSEKIFIDNNKGKWMHRYTQQASFSDLEAIFNTTETCPITIYASGQTFTVQLKAGEWKKHSAIMAKIFALIRANKPLN